MIRGAALENEYFGGQMVEVLNVHGFGAGRRETWRPAKIHRRTSRGCEVIYRDGGDNRPQHIMFSDLRPMEPTGRVVPKVSTPLLSASDIDAYNARLEAEEAQRVLDAARQPPQQPLVLLQRPPTTLPILSVSGRRKRQPKQHRLTPLSQYLRAKRVEAGMQQGTLKDQTGISRLSPIEYGDIDPTDDELLSIAGVLNLDLDHLLKLRDLDDDAEDDHIEVRKADPVSGTQAVARPFALPAEAPPPPAPQTLLEAIQTPPKPVAVERRGSEGSEQWSALLREVAQLQEENSVLRDAVVFYAGMDRP